MKGVIATIAPRTRVIDLCHEVRPFQIAHGAFVIAQSYRYFPPGTVHVVVVDPGVGSARRAIAVEAAGQYFVAPDNGVLSQVYEREDYSVRAIDADRYALKPLSRTFHGRDLFSPAGAWLANGTPFAEMGPLAGDCVRPAPTAPRALGPRRWQGRGPNNDHFGTVVTSFPAAFLLENARSFCVLAGEVEVRDRADTYANAPGNKVFAIEGSSGYVELSLTQASAADATELEIGSCVEWLTPDHA